MKITTPFQAAKVAAIVLALSAVSIRAAEAVSPALQEIIHLKERPVLPANSSRSETMRSGDEAAQKRSAAVRAFLANNPPAAERNQAIMEHLFALPPSFIKEFKPGFDENPSADLVVYDQAAKEAWQREMTSMLRIVAADTSALPYHRQHATAGVINNDIREARTLEEFSAVQARIASFAANQGSEVLLRGLQSSLLSASASLGAAQFEEFLGAIVNGANTASSQMARETLDRLQRQKADVGNIKFTAVDGLAVDLKNLRGKVVLIDFWATWCGPCIAELPNVKKVYAAYHNQGFEVIGIALENGKLEPKDTPEQTAEKLAAAKKILTDFTAKKEMPWPQYFDGRYWKNDISSRFGINAIPAMFLLDQDGKIVSTNARGPKLEAEVKRLLKL